MIFPLIGIMCVIILILYRVKFAKKLIDIKIKYGVSNSVKSNAI